MWIVSFHGISIFGVATAAALSIAGEKDRRTLDFLLATRLGNAEIVLGKLVSSLTVFFSTLAAGLPVMLLLNTLGSIDLPLILLTYAALTCLAFFLASLSIWVSTGTSDSRGALHGSILYIMAWLIGPIHRGLRSGPGSALHYLGFVLTVNAWVLARGPPDYLLPEDRRRNRHQSSRTDRHSRLDERAATVRGRSLLGVGDRSPASAYRINVSDESQGLVRAADSSRLAAPRQPAVSDDPILWREMSTSRVGFLSWAFSLIIILGIYAALGYVTYYFGRPALIEIWHHGYTAGLTTAERPESNLAVRFIMPDYGVKPPADIRKEFNILLRFITTPMMFFIAMMAATTAAAGIASERARDLEQSYRHAAHRADILRSKMLAALWQMRWVLTTLVVLWTIGLIAGAIHPLGYLAVVLELIASTWFFLARGTLASVQAKGLATATGQSPGSPCSWSFSGAVPMLLPARLNSVLLGTGSLPFVSYLSLASYRDVRRLAFHGIPPFAMDRNRHRRGGGSGSSRHV